MFQLRFHEFHEALGVIVLTIKMYLLLALVFLINQHFPVNCNKYKIFMFVHALKWFIKTEYKQHVTHPLAIFPFWSWLSWNPKTRASLHILNQTKTI